jgi:hypothetical protein
MNWNPIQLITKQRDTGHLFIRKKNTTEFGTCGGSFFEQLSREFKRLYSADIARMSTTSPPTIITSAPSSQNAFVSPAYWEYAKKLVEELGDKYSADPCTLTWDDLYGLQKAMLRLYLPEELRMKRAGLRDSFYQRVSQHLIDTYERTSPPSLSAKDSNYEADLADALYLQSALAEIDTYRPHQELKRNRITLNAFISLVFTVVLYLILGVVIYSHEGNDRTFPCFLIAMMLGALGAVVSYQRRLQTSFDQDASILNTTRYVGTSISSWLTPFLGSIFAGVLFLLVYAGLFTITTTSPGTPSQGTNSPGTTGTETFAHFLLYRPTDLIEYGKVLVYGFLAGFAERLVPDTLDRLAKASQS